MENTGLSEEHFKLLLNGMPITDRIETPRGTFTLKFMSEVEQEKFIKRKEELMRGLDANSLSEREYLFFDTQAALDTLVVSGPEGWIVGNSIKYPDKKVKSIVYRGLLQLIEKVERPEQPRSSIDALPPISGGTSSNIEEIAVNDHSEEYKPISNNS